MTDETALPRQNIVGLSKDELRAAFVDMGLEPFRVAQVWSWIYCRGALAFDGMTNLAKPVREKLAARFYIGRPVIIGSQLSTDGTRKWLVEMEDGARVECVYIPEEDRGALCISTQVGCPMGCRFCHTGTQKLTRDLTAAEMVMQVLFVRDELGAWPSSEGQKILSNIVVMGMGEPLYNYDNVAKALKIVMDESGIAIGRRKITLSTSGVVPMIERCGAELGVLLAISLHAVTDEVRSALMPINRKYPIKTLLEACRAYPGVKNARRITFEYVMLKGVNDSDDDAKALVKLLAGIPAKINLLPYNPWPGSPYECADDARIQRFGEILNRAGYASPIRTPRGRDIMAACGQLKAASEEKAAGQD